MSAIKITDKVYYVGVKHPQRRIFDELISLPETEEKAQGQ